MVRLTSRSPADDIEAMGEEAPGVYVCGDLVDSAIGRGREASQPGDRRVSHLHLYGASLVLAEIGLE